MGASPSCEAKQEIKMTIRINQLFTLKFQISRFDIAKIEKIFNVNDIKFSYEKTMMENIVDIKITQCSLRKAELVRQLLKNIKVYE